ncbi:hypothetical protein FB451DRAFT_365884 [Mycena latifolia]|nr:hypothetical protein FB451DRAFT_365884 [Mycena latifolia]
MPPKFHITRSKSVGKQPAPAAPLPPLAPPSVIAVTGYPAPPTVPNAPKTKTPLSALHFGKNPSNTYTGSKVKGKAPASPSASPTSTASTTPSSNAFAALSDHPETDTVEEKASDLPETNTVEEQATLDLLGLPDDSFSGSSGGYISSSQPRTSSPDPIKALARRLAHPRPSTPPGTTSGAGSSASTTELGCAQNADGTLRDAADIVFYNDPDDDSPLPATQGAQPWEYAATTNIDTDDSPFLSPACSKSATLPASPSNIGHAPSSTGNVSPASPIGGNIAAAAAAAGRARQARAAAASAATPPGTTTSLSAPPVLPSPALQAAPSPAATSADPLFSTVVTRSASQAARRAAAGPAVGTSPFLPLPRGSLAPHSAPTPAAAAPTTLPAAGATGPSPTSTQLSNPAPAPPLPGTATTITVVPAAGIVAPPALQPPPMPATPQSAAISNSGNAPGAPTRILPAAAAAALGGTPLPVFCNVPLDTPGIYSPDVLTARDNVAPRNLIKWDALVGNKLLAFELDGKPHSVTSTTVEDLKSGITRVTGNQAPLVGPSEAANPGNRSSPYMYLVRGLSDADSQRLLHHRVWNLVGGYTFFVIPYDAPSSPFLFTLDGFTFSADEGVDVANIVVSVIRESHDAQALLTLNHDNYPAGVDAMSHFAASVRVAPISLQNPGGGSTRTAWNVTADPPSRDAAYNRTWVATLAYLEFDSEMHWVAKAIKPAHHCSRCKSVGHVADLCPLPLLPGWFTKPAASSAAPPSASDQRGSRPPTNRGRGNGGARGRNNNRGGRN